MKGIFDEILDTEVFPALGCTEPVAVAYCASTAARYIDDTLESVEIVVDPGVLRHKNGGVTGKNLTSVGTPAIGIKR
jgi:L-cysteine desulfidase